MKAGLISQFALMFLYSVLMSSCTSEADINEFHGRYFLYENGQYDLSFNLIINPNNTFTTNGFYSICDEGLWEVSSLKTAMGLLITFNSEGEFCNQLHWKEGHKGEILESQEVDEKYVRRFKKWKEQN